MGFREHSAPVRRILGIVLAVLLVGGVAVAVAVGREPRGTGTDPGTATKTVRGVIGSEKAEFFADPKVVEALAAKGYTLRTETSGSWAMEQLPLKGYDFVFPASKAPADELRRKTGGTGTPLRPFYSPLVVVAHSNAARVLADAGLVTLRGKHSGTLRMKPLMDAAKADRTWQQLKGAEKHGELTGSLFVSTTDPGASSSGALYLAAASYVADGGRVADGEEAVARTAPLLRKLISVQGAQQTSSDAPFRDFISGVGNPLVLVYESQVASLLLRGQDAGDLVVLYPDTTVSSDHTVVPVTQLGRAIGELLTTDPTLQKLAVRHGFRPQGAPAAFASAAAPHSSYLNQSLTGVRQAPVPTSAVLHALAQRAQGGSS
ncbi:hypothetical protein OG897_24260 [Streptomyces sp. NBC_00237]|uniref:hypothetical protein n=1 Tax=Streptomyces sp. NBC_00237 TaxID=2975687 RepID=UPI00224F830A|nr:hypothetical protein [Streptomyces sp. NBC_00237]MCX5204556.1 hypothetical protein [Streptomyces sp. NBC_00237]